MIASLVKEKGSVEMSIDGPGLGREISAENIVSGFYRGGLDSLRTDIRQFAGTGKQRELERHYVSFARYAERMGYKLPEEDREYVEGLERKHHMHPRHSESRTAGEVATS